MSAEQTDWDSRVLAAQQTGNLGAHFMQSDAWAELKADSPWLLGRLDVGAGAFPIQTFTRNVTGMGPLNHWPRVTGVTADLIPALTDAARESTPGTLAVKLEFFQAFDQSLVDAFTTAGWVLSKASQYRHAVVVDTSGTEDELLARFKKRCRYEVRLAAKSGVTVSQVEPTEANMQRLLTLIRETEHRTKAFFRSDDYLLNSWRTFANNGQGFIYLAEHEGDLVAGAFVFTYGTVGWYKDGGSTRAKDKLGGARYLQFCIMRDLQKLGVTQYDLGVIPPPEQAENSAMKGLFTFKTSFSEETTTFMPAFQLPLGKRFALWQKHEGKYLGAYSRLKRDYWY